MHPNPVTSSRGRRKAAAKPAAAGVRIRAADADALGAFDLPAAPIPGPLLARLSHE